MELRATPIDGCLAIQPFCARDDRGEFVKTFHADVFAAQGISANWREAYYSRSRQGVIRGMHFQLPPCDHAKIVFCMQGRVLDVVLDLRTRSATFGRHMATELDGTCGEGLVIPRGMAHGFLVLSDEALMAYTLETVHAPSHDAGIRWDSFGMDWGVRDPILSARDRAHPAFHDFQSPF
jgi:dTDP-4-dehydrorhamnose 3,5-epimerase